MPLSKFEKLFEEKIKSLVQNKDPAHDLLHFKRVVKTAKHLCEQEKANIEVVVPAAWLHDFVIVSKDSPLRSQASRFAAEKAVEFLSEIKYPEKYYREIAHAIEAHSFSAGIEPTTIEAGLVQDADRLDALGAIGIARCFATAGLLRRDFYEEQDPFCSERELNDRVFTVDHFYKKLFKISETLKTASGRAEGRKRVEFMKLYLKRLGEEIAVF